MLSLPYSMDPRWVERAKFLVSKARATKTWDQYHCVRRKVERMEEQYEVDLSFPWTAEKLNLFICICHEQGLKASSIRSYKSQISSAHVLEGFKFIGDSSISKFLLQGAANSEVTKKKRLAVSPYLLRVLKSRLRFCSLEVEDKLMMWSIFTILFFGSLRSSELLSKFVNSFGDTTLIGRDVTWTPDSQDGWLSLNLRGPKEVRGMSSIMVEVLGIEDKNLCPLDAWSRWRRRAETRRPLDPELPVFRFAGSGKCVTSQFVNSLLKSLLSGDVNYDVHGVLLHSFRAGLVTFLARHGYGEEQIKVLGRWKSSSWMAYVKLGRGLRRADMRNMGRLVSSSSITNPGIRIVDESDLQVAWQ